MFSLRFHAPPLEGGVLSLAAVLRSGVSGDLQIRCEVFFNCSFIKPAANRAAMMVFGATVFTLKLAVLVIRVAAACETFESQQREECA